MAKFKERLTPPPKTDKNWIHISKGGKNPCILIAGNSVLPNCVGYAWGRFREILGESPRLSNANAEEWWDYKEDGYKRGSVPELGAVICWRKGSVNTTADGAGHVAIVEKIKNNGDIVISQSGYGSSRFWTSTVKNGYSLSGYIFQGFIYNPKITKGTTVNNSNLGKEVNMIVNELKKGSTGNQVKTIQRILYCRYGCPDDLPITGNFGSVTQKYVKAFQKAKNLPVTGTVDLETWKALVK